MDQPLNDPQPQRPVPDFEELSRNMALFIEEAGRATAAYLKPLEQENERASLAEQMQGVVKTLGDVAEVWFSHPQKALEAQSLLSSQFIALWGSTLKRMQGKLVAPIVTPKEKDARFSDPDWSTNPVFDFLKQAYLITTQWAEELVERADGLDAHTRDKARFYVKQLSGALSPSNFLATNPELIRKTIEESGANLVRGMTMLAEDIEAGGGDLKIRHADGSRFKVGVNLATTPGKVVFRNELIELIQYAPTTETVLARPLLIVPPWINKYYVLDLTPEKSFIRWAVAQGLTVFCISWVNPREAQAEKSFEHYMREGIFAALDAIEQATGEKKTTAVGYCVGGTLLAVALAYMAAKRDTRIDSATFLTTQVDFSDPGDLKVFVDDAQIHAIEAMMKVHGYLQGTRMATAFNMLRPNDLIWPYVVNVYLKGHSPFPFDLLYWNSDSTRLPAANHAFYLRNCYLHNRLAKGDMKIEGVSLDLKKIKIPIFNLASREDHIAPARSVYLGSKAFGSSVEYVLAGSGHIAGVINPPDRAKYQFWTGGPVEGSFDDWVTAATEHPGTWWPYWFSWIEKQATERVPARKPGGKALKALCDAPGTYVTAP